MNNINKVRQQEFIGKSGFYVADEENVYIYDEVSFGIYKIYCTTNIVDLIMSYEQLLGFGLSDVRDLKKYGNNLIIIPPETDIPWIIYDLESGEIKRNIPAFEKDRFDRALRINNDYYLVPVYTTEPLYRFNEHCDFLEKIEHWYKGEKEECWMPTCNADEIIIPIHNTCKVLKIHSDRSIEEVRFRNGIDIHMVVKAGGGTCILPWNGEKFFIIDENNEYKELKVINTDGNFMAMDQFIRVVPIKKGIILLPFVGKEVYLWRYGDKSFMPIKIESDISEQNCGIYGGGSYWGYADFENEVHLVPTKYRYAKIDIEKRVMNYCKLKYGSTFSPQEYAMWERSALKKKKNFIIEKNLKDLEEYLEIV